jgi:hypothetical protein
MGQQWDPLPRCHECVANENGKTALNNVVDPGCDGAAQMMLTRSD